MSNSLPATLRGTVTKFKGNGRKLGYPTANIHTVTDLDDAVYFGYADLGKFLRYPALIFIGTPTTVGDTERRVEAWLPDIPDQDYYGEDLTLDIIAFHRANEHFASVEELLDVMKSDEATARRWFKDNS